MKFEKTSFALAAAALCAGSFGAHAATPAPTSGTLEIWWKAPATNGATVSGTLQDTTCYVNGRGVSRVEFFLDSTRLNTDTVMSDGMSCVLDTRNFANGTHTLTAVAYDSAGRTYREPRTISIQNANTPPVVSFSRPANGASVAPGQVSCLVSATDSDGIRQLQWFLDGRLINTELSAPYDTCNINTTGLSGAHVISAVATDNRGATGSAQVTINVGGTTTTTSTNTPPAVSFSRPTNGSTVAAGWLSCAVTATDADGIRQLQWYFDGRLINTELSAPYDTCNVNATGLSGQHVIRAVATDNRGAVGEASVTVNVGSSQGTSTTTPPVSSLPSTNTRAIPTFESIGLYWTPPSAPGNGSCDIQYRKAGESAWRQGYPMWYDSRNSECRGSIVHLQPDSNYEVQFALPGQSPVAGLVTKTWSENFPVAQTVYVTNRSTPLVITQGGTASGYVLYTPAPGTSATIDVNKSADYNIRISAPYVIIRGLTLRGSAMDAIKIEEGARDLVIEDNDISEWSSWGGYTSAEGWRVARNKDAGVKAYCSSGPWLERTVIQRNRFHHPTYGSNSWSGFSSGPSDPHPLGPNAIYMLDCGGNHVWRYNEIYSSTGRYFMDAFGGGENFSTKGFPNADTDIYGNRIQHAWDDAIEAEGANRNVRIWGNYMDRTTTGVATTSTSVGPVYVFRNVQNRSHHLSTSSLDSDSALYMFKSGSQSGYGDGRRYVFHNTSLQAPPPAGSTVTQGVGEGLSGPNSNQRITNTVSRNNVYHVRKAWWSSINTQGGGGNDLDYDLVNGNVSAYSGAEANRIVGVPSYASGNGWSSEGNGMYQLAPSSLGYGRGVRLPNFNDAYAAPDMGAHQSGTAAMRLGISGAGGVWAATTGETTTAGTTSSTGTSTTASSGGVCSTATCVLTQ